MPGYNPATFTSNVVNATALGTTSGNQNLQSEVAFSKTFGVVLRPRWVPKLNISVDYIDIALKDAIESLTLTDNLDACYDSTEFPEQSLLQHLHAKREPAKSRTSMRAT